MYTNTKLVDTSIRRTGIMFAKTTLGITVARRRGFRRKTEYLGYFFQEWLFFLTIGMLIIKSIILMGFLYSSDQSVIDIANGLKNIKYMSICVAPLVALASFNFLFKNKGRLWFLIVLNFLCSFLFLFDAVYLRASGNFLSFQLIRQIGIFDNHWGSIFALFRPCDVAFFFDIPIIAIILIVTRKLYYSSPLFSDLKVRVISFITVFIISIVVIFSRCIAINFYGNDKNDFVFYSFYNPGQTICNNSPMAYHFLDCYTFLFDFRSYEKSS